MNVVIDTGTFVDDVDVGLGKTIDIGADFFAGIVGDMVDAGGVIVDISPGFGNIFRLFRAVDVAAAVGEGFDFGIDDFGLCKDA